MYPDEQLEKDICNLREMGICQWFQHLSWRVPDSDVVLVATKCDLLPDEKARDTADRIEKACRAWLLRLKTNVKIDGGIILTSCKD